MVDEQLARSVLRLTASEPRRANARALAERIGAEDLVVFVQDPDLGVLLPASGFPQTLPCGRAWREFVAACTTDRDQTGELWFPDEATRVSALGISSGDGSVVVLLGGRPSAAAVAELKALLPHLAVVLRHELASIATAGRASLAWQAARRAETLAGELDAARGQLQSTVAQLRESQAETELIYRLTAVVSRGAPLDEVFRTALDSIEGAFRVKRSAVRLRDAEGVMRFEAWRGLSACYRRAVEGHTPWAPGETEPLPLIVRDVESEAAMATLLPSLRMEEVRAVGFIPLLYNDRLLGTFSFYSAECRDFSEQDIRLAQTIADHVARAVGRERDEREREQLIAELDRAVRLGEMFVGILGHDLQSPLSSAALAANLIVRRSHGEVSRLARGIMNNTQRMSRLVDQLLDVTRIRLGEGLPLQPQPVELTGVCRSVIEELDVEGGARDILLETSGNVRGTWDPDRLAQLISNLIGNALQHRVSGTPVAVYVDGTAADVARIQIKNQGVLPRKKLPTLFQPFQSKTRYESGGLGLGLYIAQQIAFAHDGVIEVQSSEGDGTSFTLELPRNPGAGR